MKVSILVAADIAEADEVQRLLATAGIDSSLEPVETDGAPAVASDGPCRVLVAADQQESALAALQADAEEDEADDGW
jgi:hypothetical protein